MKPLFFLLCVNLLFALFRILYILLYPLDLSPEEAQYWDWSRHLDLSYYSKPPMVAYMIFVSRTLLSDTELAVRIVPVLLSFLLSVATYLFLRDLVGERKAVVASTVPHLFVGPSINSVLMTTDSPFVFFWGITILVLYRAILNDSVTLWILVGILAGLSFLSKYTAVFLLPLGILSLYFLRRDKVFSPKPYLSLIPAFILSLPVLLWNAKHGWVSVKHVLSLGFSGSSRSGLGTFFEFLGGQVLLMSLFPFFLMVLSWLKPRNDLERFLTVFSLPIFFFFGLLSLKKEVYANWTAPAIFSGILLASFRMAERSFLLGISISVAFPLFILLHFTPLLDKLGLRELLPPKRDPVKVMVGWEKLGKEVSGLYRRGDIILSDRYQISAELAFYVEGRPRTFVFHRGRRTQYYLWRGLLSGYKGKDGLFVTEGSLPEGVKRSFVSFEFVKDVEVYWRGERVRRFRIYRLKEFSGILHEEPKGY